MPSPHPLLSALFLFGCLVPFAGCGKTVPASDIAGQYSSTSTSRPELLILTSAGTFEQVITGPRGAITRQSGRWEFVPEMLGNGRVRCRDLLMYIDIEGKRMQTPMLSTIEFSFGHDARGTFLRTWPESPIAWEYRK
jgi:hypothetical protein